MFQRKVLIVFVNFSASKSSLDTVYPIVQQLILWHIRNVQKLNVWLKICQDIHKQCRQGKNKDVLGKCQGNFKGASKVVQGCFENVFNGFFIFFSEMFQGSFTYFDGCFKYVLFLTACFKVVAIIMKC